MNPLPQTKLRNIAPLLAALISESHCEERTTVEYCLEKLAQGYITQTMDAYVDSVESPRQMIVFGRYPGLATKEELIYVNCIYSVPEDRLKPETAAAFKNVIEKYCEAHRRDAIIASSWEYRDSRGIGQFWRNLGFERQEVVYVKHLKH